MGDQFAARKLPLVLEETPSKGAVRGQFTTFDVRIVDVPNLPRKEVSDRVPSNDHIVAPRKSHADLEG